MPKLGLGLGVPYIQRKTTAAPVPVIPSVQLTGFRVTTTSGNISVDWGDGTSDSLNSDIPVDHTFFCPDYSAPQSDFWNNINPCV